MNKERILEEAILNLREKAKGYVVPECYWYGGSVPNPLNANSHSDAHDACHVALDFYDYLEDVIKANKIAPENLG